jgi:hypothetical protein
MHRDDYTPIDVLLMTFGPPLFGAVVGLVAGLWRQRPARAALGGLAGGTAGAWAGLALYRTTILPEGRDLIIFEACVLTGLLVGSIPLGWLLAGRKLPAGEVRFLRRLGGVGGGLAISGILLSCMGFFPFQLGSEASANIPVPPDVKYLGIYGMLAGLALLAAGVAWMRAERKERSPPDSHGSPPTGIRVP